MAKMELGAYLDKRDPNSAIDLRQAYLPKELRSFRDSMESLAKIERALKTLQDETKEYLIPTTENSNRFIRNLNFCLNLLKCVEKIPLQDDSEKDVRESRSKILRSRIAAEIGFGYHAKKRYAKASEVFRRAAEKADLPFHQSYLQVAQGTIEIVRGKSKEAKKCYQAALNLLRRNDGASFDPQILREIYDLVEFRGRELLTKKPLFDPSWSQLTEYQQGVAPIRLEIANMFEALARDTSGAYQVANLHTAAGIRASCGSQEAFEFVMEGLQSLDSRDKLWPLDRLLWVERSQHDRMLAASEELIHTVFDELEDYWSKNPREVGSSWEHRVDVMAKLMSLYSRQVLLQHNEHLLQASADRFSGDTGAGAAERNTDTLVNQWSDHFPVPFISQVANLANEALTMGKPGLTMQLLELVETDNWSDEELALGRSGNLLKTRTTLLQAFASHDLARSVAAIYRRLRRMDCDESIYSIADSAEKLADRKLTAILTERGESVVDDYLHFLEALEERVSDHTASAKERYDEVMQRIHSFHRRYFDDVPDSECKIIRQARRDLPKVIEEEKERKYQ